MSCRKHGYPWPSLATSPYHSSPLAGLQGYIPYPHIAAECMFELVVLLLPGHMWGSIGVLVRKWTEWREWGSNSFTSRLQVIILAITPGNSLRMMNLLIQWMTGKYVLEHRLFMCWKNLGPKTTKEFVEKLLKSLQDIGAYTRTEIHF